MANARGPIRTGDPAGATTWAFTSSAAVQSAVVTAPQQTQVLHSSWYSVITGAGPGDHRIPAAVQDLRLLRCGDHRGLDRRRRCERPGGGPGRVTGADRAPRVGHVRAVDLRALPARRAGHRPAGNTDRSAPGNRIHRPGPAPRREETHRDVPAAHEGPAGHCAD